MAITNVTEALEALRDLADGLPTAVEIDNTLSVEGAAADSAVVGEALTALGSLIEPHINETSNPHNVTAAQVGAAPAYSYGTDDLTAGTSALETGKLHFVYE